MNGAQGVSAHSVETSAKRLALPTARAGQNPQPPSHASIAGTVMPTRFIRPISTPISPETSSRMRTTGPRQNPLPRRLWKMVLGAGLEPARLSPYAPQTYVSANSTTRAFSWGGVDSNSAKSRKRSLPFCCNFFAHPLVPPASQDRPQGMRHGNADVRCRHSDLLTRSGVGRAVEVLRQRSSRNPESREQCSEARVFLEFWFTAPLPIGPALSGTHISAGR